MTRYGRIMLISMAALYIVAGLSVLNAFFFREKANTGSKD